MMEIDTMERARRLWPEHVKLSQMRGIICARGGLTRTQAATVAISTVNAPWCYTAWMSAFDEAVKGEPQPAEAFPSGASWVSPTTATGLRSKASRPPFLDEPDNFPARADDDPLPAVHTARERLSSGEEEG